MNINKTWKCEWLIGHIIFIIEFPSSYLEFDLFVYRLLVRIFLFSIIGSICDPQCSSYSFFRYLESPPIDALVMSKWLIIIK